jgi:hypothetical protein
MKYGDIDSPELREAIHLSRGGAKEQELRHLREHREELRHPRGNGMPPLNGSKSGPEPSGTFGTDPKARVWPKPEHIPDGLLPVDPFDLAFLPAGIAPWVEDIATRMQCPLDFVGVSAMVALGSVIGRRVGVRPQRRTDWLEVPNLWGCIVGRPGAMKSPAMAEALKPLHRLEAAARIENETSQNDYAIKIETFKLQQEAARAAAKVALKTGGKVDTILNVQQPEEPRLLRYITNDSTYEALGEILADNPNGVLAFRDELVSLLRTLDREEYAAARGFFLSAWNGTGGYTFDRITRGKIHIEAACVSLFGSTQPGRLAEYIRHAISGGASDDGLVQRFGLLVWPDASPSWKEVDCFPDSAARKAANEIFDNLNKITPEAIGAQTDNFNPIPFLRFDDEAQELFIDWRADLEHRLRSDEMHPALESHLSKFRKLVSTLALINCLADGGAHAIDAAALLRALAFAKYLETHARRCYGAGTEAEASAAKAILKHIRRGDLVEGFTARDIYRNHWSDLCRVEQIQAGLDLLADLNWIAAVTSTTGGRPKTTHHINPGARP